MNDVVFNDVGAWRYVPWSFTDLDGKSHPSGKYWYVGYQEGVGFLLANDDQSGTQRFFVENGGLVPVFIAPWPSLLKNLWWILLALLALFYILKRK
jgi:hypothetical protein